MPKHFPMPSTIFNCCKPSNFLNKFVSLLVHLLGTQSHDVQQLQLVAQHLHFSALHKNFLLHEQYLLDQAFPITLVCSSTRVLVFKHS